MPTSSPSGIIDVWAAILIAAITSPLSPPTGLLAIGLEILEEQVHIGVYATTSQSGRLEILYGAEGLTPLFETMAFHGEIIEAKAPYGEEIVTFIPPIETLPEAPYASVVTMSGTIGPKNLTYYKRVHGRRVAFKPEGIELPKRCPHVASSSPQPSRSSTGRQRLRTQ